MHITIAKSQWILRWPVIFLALLAVLFFMRLGFWQLHRGNEKKHMVAAYQQFAKQKAHLWSLTMPLPQQYERIRVQGNFMPTLIFLDNQHYQHQFGYSVISPLLLDNDQVVLIDRGWVAGDVTRETLPKVEVLTTEENSLGYVYYPSAHHWLLGPLLDKKEKNLVVVEGLDLEMIAQFLHKKVYPFMIRLDKKEAHGYVRQWPIVAMPPERHYAYALQWFIFAVLVVVLLFSLTREKIHETQTQQ